MKKPLFLFILFIVLVPTLLTAGCSQRQPGAEKIEGMEDIAEGAEGNGTLIFTANGEEFAREGFTSKDGWKLIFDHVYVTISDITAYQSNPPYDTGQGWDISYNVKVELEETYTADLALPHSDPAVLSDLSQVPAGHYNALSWTMAKADEGPAAGYSLFLIGSGEKDGQIIDFTLGIEQEVAYLGGDYIGDERKGIVEPGSSADLEMTFHFDHLFGDGEEDPEDHMNLGAFGFEPLAGLAEDGAVAADLAVLNEVLSPEEYELLLSILTHLAHVGEGHCLAEFVN